MQNPTTNLYLLDGATELSFQEPEYKEKIDIDTRDAFLKQRFSKLAFLMFGFGMLLPFNVIMAALDFFDEHFPSYNPNFSLLTAVSVPLFFT